MPRPSSSRTYSFETNVMEYRRPFLDDLDFTRAGNVFLESEEGQPINFSFVWGRRVGQRSFAYQRWEKFEEFLGMDSSSNEEMDGLNFVEFKLRSEPDNVFYLALPKNLEVNPFIDLDDAIIVSKSSNPTTDNNIFEQLIAPEYELDYVEEVELNFNENVEEIDLDNNLEARQSVASTPEPSAISGMVLLGVLFVGVIAKRAASKLRSRLRITN